MSAANRESAPPDQAGSAPRQDHRGGALAWHSGRPPARAAGRRGVAAADAPRCGTARRAGRADCYATDVFGQRLCRPSPSIRPAKGRPCPTCLRHSRRHHRRRHLRVLGGLSPGEARLEGRRPAGAGAGFTCGTTWHAAGLIGQLRGSQNMTRLAKYSADSTGGWRSTEVATGLRQVGSITVALTEARREESYRQATLARAFDVEVDGSRRPRRRRCTRTSTSGT